MVYIILVFVAVIALFVFNPTANRIRKIQSLLNKDRTVCDVINALDGWSITNLPQDTLQITINPPFGMPTYNMYITYKGKWPSSEDIKFLYKELTDENSIVTKAHKANVPVEVYLENMTKAFEKFLEEQDGK